MNIFIYLFIILIMIVNLLTNYMIPFKTFKESSTHFYKVLTLLLIVFYISLLLFLIFYDTKMLMSIKLVMIILITLSITNNILYHSHENIKSGNKRRTIFITFSVTFLLLTASYLIEMGKVDTDIKQGSEEGSERFMRINSPESIDATEEVGGTMSSLPQSEFQSPAFKLLPVSNSAGNILQEYDETNPLPHDSNLLPTMSEVPRTPLRS